MSLVRRDKHSNFYHLKYRKVNQHQHKRALTLTAQFMRLIFRLLKDNFLYKALETH